MKFDKFYNPSSSMLIGYSRYHHSFGEVAILLESSTGDLNMGCLDNPGTPKASPDVPGAPRLLQGRGSPVC